MLIRRVTAQAFGPLVAQTLTFVDGMTVVYGANESAKSTWHAAVYAALCGRRRGKVPSAEERRFAELHRPWDRDDWIVSAEVELDDGRRLEVRQDLAGKVDCDVRDLDLGRDCSAQFLSDGTPDLTRWLGLDRHSFLATAHVAQARALAVHEYAGGLQEQLQKAAATGGADHTVASAIDRIDEFRRERVGSERAPKRPLRRALAAVQDARTALDEAREAHAAYEAHLVRLDGLRTDAAEAERRLRRHEAVALARAARAARETAEEAGALYERLGGVEPMSSAAQEGTAREVAAALAAWDSRPAALIVPQQSGLATDDVPDDQLYELARVLELTPQTVEAGAQDRVSAVRDRLVAAERSVARRRLSIASGVVAGVISAVTGILAATVIRGDGSADGGFLLSLLVGVAALAAVACVVTIVRAGVRPGGAGTAKEAAKQVVELRQEALAAEMAVAAMRTAQRAAAARRAEALAQVAALGIPADPPALRELARARVGQVALADRDEQWLAEIAHTRSRAADLVDSAARRCGLAAASAEQAVRALRQWQTDHAKAAETLDEARRDAARLALLLGGGGLPELRQAAATADVRAGQAREGIGDDELASVGDVDEQTLARLRAAARQADARASEAEGAGRALAVRLAGPGSPGSGSPQVGQAEEELARAEEELRRLQALAETLELTRGFLVTAQERAHRTIAPVLVRTLREWLPELTGERYTEVSVDPERLRVSLRGPAGRWREADLLSHGTAEQVYLLLRIALARHVVRPGTSCPLLLDEVTVHADTQRTAQMLRLLLRASDERQIVLFTQQEQVLHWARTHLEGPRHAVHELAPVTSV